MPLENLVGSDKYIDDLNKDWPAGTDYPDAGDDHMRGIKNVLKNTFPNINGPITLTDEELNRGSVPAGSRTVFYQSAAPTGWSRVTGLSTTYGLRIVASATVGGTSGGSDDPVLNNKVPSHTHSYSFTTGNESADHTHAFSALTGYMNENASHGHGVSDPGHKHTLGIVLGVNNNDNAPMPAASNGVGVLNYYADVSTVGTGISIAGTDTNHTHNVSGVTGGRSGAHTHAGSGTTVANTYAANWVPRYLDMILCQKS